MKLKLALLIAAVITLHCCTAAPYANDGDILPRPSPINPEIPMDPKPAETITFITDPKEIAKFKREISVDTNRDDGVTVPTTIPPTHPHPIYQPDQAGEHAEISQQHQHHHQKRETKADTSIVPQTLQKPTSNSPTKQSTAPLNDKQTTAKTQPKRKRNRTTSTTTTTTTTTSTQAPTRSTTKAAAQIKHRQKRDENQKDGAAAAVPLIYRDQHKQPKCSLSHETPKTTMENHETAAHSTKLEQQQQPVVRPQTLPPLINAQRQTQHTESKRDIPVPLVPKYHHPEESPKSEEKQDAVSTNTASDKPTEHSSVITPSTTKHIVTETTPVEKKPEKRTATENPDVLQVEDLSEQHQTHTAQHTAQHQRHQQQETPSSTGPSIFRHRPVPVAELFAKGKTTETPEEAHHHEHHEAQH